MPPKGSVALKINVSGGHSAVGMSARVLSSIYKKSPLNAVSSSREMHAATLDAVAVTLGKSGTKRFGFVCSQISALSGRTTAQ